MREQERETFETHDSASDNAFRNVAATVGSHAVNISPNIYIFYELKQKTKKSTTYYSLKLKICTSKKNPKISQFSSLFMEILMFVSYESMYRYIRTYLGTHVHTDVQKKISMKYELTFSCTFSGGILEIKRSMWPRRIARATFTLVFLLIVTIIFILLIPILIVSGAQKARRSVEAELLTLRC